MSENIAKKLLVSSENFINNAETITQVHPNTLFTASYIDDSSNWIGVMSTIYAISSSSKNHHINIHNAHIRLEEDNIGFYYFINRNLPANILDKDPVASSILESLNSSKINEGANAKIIADHWINLTRLMYFREDS